MSIITKILELFLGNKYERDIKEISPYVEKIHEEFKKLRDLTNDQLRDKTLELKKVILDYIEEDEKEMIGQIFQLDETVVREIMVLLELLEYQDQRE